MDAARRPAREELDDMAEDESLLTNPPTQEVAAHVRDYSRFIAMFKWGALASFVIAMAVMVIISN
jgi:hypothetical protein